MKYLDMILYLGTGLIYAILLFGGVTYGFIEMAKKGMN